MQHDGDDVDRTHTGERSATTLWPISAAVITALDEHLGSPVDCYVNGSQTWLTPDGPNEIMLEWRLHPVGGYTTPAGMSHYEVFETVVAAIAVGADIDALSLGTESRPLEALWTGLECFAAYGDPLNTTQLAEHATTALGLSPAYQGLVDHQRVGEAWERSQRATDLYELVKAELAATTN